jgi:hypothetical protein
MDADERGWIADARMQPAPARADTSFIRLGHRRPSASIGGFKPRRRQFATTAASKELSTKETFLKHSADSNNNAEPSR